jgi:DNA-binding NarL/FixJ family response regulator
MFRQGLRVLLEREKFEVVAEVADGLSAVATAQRLKPDIAVLDFSMPELNGLDAARQIGASGLDTEVVLLTAYDEEAYMIGAQRAAVRGYVLKSQAASDLVEVIRKIVKCRRRLRNKSHLFRSATQAYGGRIQSTMEILTDRERQILGLIAEGSTTRQAANLLGISVKTADSHRSHLMQKLEVHETASLVRYAVRQGLVQA